MAPPDYSTWLAANVLNEKQMISYRNMSRALKVHSNTAKQMLYDFHHKQNSKRPGSIHATYLLTGTKRPVQTNGVHSQQDDDNSVMRSSPPLPSSSMHPPDDYEQEVIPIRSIMLVKEEHLDQAKALFDEITGVHIYSLQAGRLSDVQGLAECNRQVATEYASEDPLTAWQQYGVIQNPKVKRRTGRRPPPTPAPPAAGPEAVKAKAAASAASKTSTADLQAASKPASKTATPESSKPAASRPPALKKQESSLFKSFAKGAAKPKKPEAQQGSAAAHATLVGQSEDVHMTGFSDDEGDDGTDGGLPEELADIKAPGGKSKKDRQAELDAMMDMEDEPMGDAEEPTVEEEEAEQENAEQNVDEPTVDKTDSQIDEPKETTVVENGRRRGRRRVMKKKTVKDEEGYLVTREEAAWESFSEEEPAPKKHKVQAPVSNKPAAKTGGKPGQGNIMSFFSKR